MTTENQAPEGAPAAAIQPLPQPEFDALMDHIYEHGTMAEGITARARAMCEAYARAALAAQPQVTAWQPIETAPGDTLVVVAWWESDETPHYDFDHIEDGCWQLWHDHAEHVEIIGGHGVSYVAPYTHWLPLPGIPYSPSPAAPAVSDDTKRLDWLAERLLGADWAYGEPATSVWLIQTDAAISADLRASIDAAMQAAAPQTKEPTNDR